MPIRNIQINTVDGRSIIVKRTETLTQIKAAIKALEPGDFFEAQQGLFVNKENVVTIQLLSEEE